MAGVKVKLIPSGIEQLKKSPTVVTAMERAAAPIATRARSSAPVDTGQYAASIHVETDPQTGRVRVVADAPHALVVEARTGNLARAVGP